MADDPIQYDDVALLELGKLAAKVWGDKKARRQFVAAVRMVDPDRRYPEQDVEDLREEIATRLETDQVTRDAAATEARLGAQRQALLDSGGFTEDQVKEIETKVMPKFGIADYTAAAKIYAADMVPAAPTPSPPSHGGTWELPTFEGLLKDPVRSSRNMAYKVIDEIAAARGVKR